MIGGRDVVCVFSLVLSSKMSFYLIPWLNNKVDLIFFFVVLFGLSAVKIGGCYNHNIRNQYELILSSKSYILFIFVSKKPTSCSYPSFESYMRWPDDIVVESYGVLSEIISTCEYTSVLLPLSRSYPTDDKITGKMVLIYDRKK